MLSIPLCLLLPLIVHAFPRESVVLPYDDGEEPHPTQPYVSEIELMMEKGGAVFPTYAAPLKDLEQGIAPTNALDDTVKERMKEEVVDQMLRDETARDQEESRGLTVEVGPDQNADLHYAVRAKYVCPYSIIGYALSWKYRLIEQQHADMRGDTENATCTFTLSAYDLQATRLIAGTPDERISLRYANEFLERNNVTITIGRGDNWPEPANNETLNPTFNVERIETDGMHYSSIFEAFANMTNLSNVARFHSRCALLREMNMTFYPSLCPSDDFYEGEPRTFYGKSRKFADAETALDMNLLLKDLFPPDQSVCGETEVAPAKQHLQHQGFVQTMDLPSLFAIEQVKLRVNFERFIASEPFPVWLEGEEAPSDTLEQALYTRHLDQAELVLSRIRGAEAVDHITVTDREDMKKRAIEDCEKFDNAAYRYYLTFPWYERIFYWFFYSEVDCQ